MSGEDNVQLCQFCDGTKSKYICPKCNAPYCSVECYKAPGHMKCSEEFFKKCVQDDLSAADPNSSQDVKKVYEILRRINETDAVGFDPKDFDTDSLDDSLDSDDDQPNIDEQEDGNEADDEADLEARLEGIDLDNPVEVWSRLTDVEQNEFQKLIENGEILKLVPKDHVPWWQKHQNSKIVDLTERDRNIPEIYNQIPKFSTLYKKAPSPCVHFNLWNIIAAYACVIRYNNILDQSQDHSKELVVELVNLSATLKYGTNFEDIDGAVISVEMEAITTRSGHGGVIDTTDFKNLAKNRDTLQQDARQLMAQQRFKLAALSDIFRWLLITTKEYTSKTDGANADFYTLFAVGHGCARMTSFKLKQISKKVEFFLSYLSRDSDNDYLK